MRQPRASFPRDASGQCRRLRCEGPASARERRSANTRHAHGGICCRATISTCRRVASGNAANASRFGGNGRENGSVKLPRVEPIAAGGVVTRKRCRRSGQATAVMPRRRKAGMDTGSAGPSPSSPPVSALRTFLLLAPQIRVAFDGVADEAAGQFDQDGDQPRMPSSGVGGGAPGGSLAIAGLLRHHRLGAGCRRTVEAMQRLLPRTRRCRLPRTPGRRSRRLQAPRPVSSVGRPAPMGSSPAGKRAATIRSAGSAPIRGRATTASGSGSVARGPTSRVSRGAASPRTPGATSSGRCRRRRGWRQLGLDGA